MSSHRVATRQDIYPRGIRPEPIPPRWGVCGRVMHQQQPQADDLQRGRSMPTRDHPEAVLPVPEAQLLAAHCAPATVHWRLPSMATSPPTTPTTAIDLLFETTGRMGCGLWHLRQLPAEAIPCTAGRGIKIMGAHRKPPSRLIS